MPLALVHCVVIEPGRLEDVSAVDTVVRRASYPQLAVVGRTAWRIWFQLGSLTAHAATFLRAAAQAAINIVVSGGAQPGETTMDT